jgi:hypothetical protein
MAVLEETEAVVGRGRWLRRLGGLAVLFLVGCMFLDNRLAQDLGPAFSHQRHVSELALNCVVCHKDIDGLDRPSLPPQDLCMLCHGRLDSEKPPERRADVFFTDGVHQPLNALSLGSEVAFSHKAHLGRVGDCATCHTGISASERLGPSDQIGMARCVSCHTESGVADDCSVCHTAIDADWQPPSHGRLWEQAHGSVSRSGSCELTDECSLCHTESSCVTCHLSEKPSSHTNFFRLRSHAFEASIDRTGCMACHRDDSCMQCHESTRPLSHKGMFGNARNTHCLGCHLPLRNEGCFVCHKSTPSHLDATPMPSDHSPAFNCRQCHGAGAPLPHVDDGSACTACHLP